MLVILCVILVLLVRIYFYARSVIHPIRYLSEVADKISMGELDTPIQIKEKGEVGALAESIERMQTSVKAAIERLQKRREASKTVPLVVDTIYMELGINRKEIKKGEAMIFPRGEVLHRNLSTAYTDFPALLSTLKTGDFSGIIEIEFPENKGVIFIDSGEIINAEAKIGADSKRIDRPGGYSDSSDPLESKRWSD